MRFASVFSEISLLGYLNIFICVGVTFIKCGKAKSFKFGHQSLIMTFVDNNLSKLFVANFFFVCAFCKINIVVGL